MANTGLVYADGSITTDGQSAQARVKFKIVIAPSLSMNTAALSTGGLIAGSNSSGINPAVLPVEKAPPSPLDNPTVGRYIFAESTDRKPLDSRQKGMRHFVLCSP